ncbi:MAG: hypothetical protein ACJ8M4_05030 [Chthoniobacterales bacterium]
MALAQEHYRAARVALPRLPLPAILAFAVAGMGGSIFLAYSSFSHGPAQYSFAAAQDVPVYSVRAVPFERPAADPVERAHSVAEALTATPSETRRSSATFNIDGGAPIAASSVTNADQELRGFPGASGFAGGNTYLALAASSIGISAQTAPVGYAAADAETFTASPVPEASTWLCGAGLMVLVAGRGAHARWRRNRHRG